MVAGDINAEVVGVRTGAAALTRLVQRYGLETFWESVERMFDHGEAVVRSYFESIPDGRYTGPAMMDNEGHFRPIEIVARPGSMFHPRSPSPCFLYGWPALQAIEVIYDAVAKAMP